MQAKDLALAKGPVLQVPVDLGGIAISYNIPGVRSGLEAQRRGPRRHP
jgi:ABC-type phosphate transport system substrate-binding protein